MNLVAANLRHNGNKAAFPQSYWVFLCVGLTAEAWSSGSVDELAANANDAINLVHLYEPVRNPLKVTEEKISVPTFQCSLASTERPGWTIKQPLVANDLWFSPANVSMATVTRIHQRRSIIGCFFFICFVTVFVARLPWSGSWPRVFLHHVCRILDSGSRSVDEVIAYPMWPDKTDTLKQILDCFVGTSPETPPSWSWLG